MRVIRSGVVIWDIKNFKGLPPRLVAGDVMEFDDKGSCIAYDIAETKNHQLTAVRRLNA